MFRKLTGLMLRVNQLAVDLHVEDAAAALDQFGINPCRCFDCVRQTGGCGRVVSLHAVSDADVHNVTPSYEWETSTTRAMIDNLFARRERRVRSANEQSAGSHPGRATG